MIFPAMVGIYVIFWKIRLEILWTHPSATKHIN